jgi:hypothetical protein
VTLHRRSQANEAGYFLGEDFHATRVTLNGSPRNLREWRELIQQLESIAPRPAPPNSRARNALVRRIGALRLKLKQAAIIRYQRSLFDRRLDAEAAAREAVARRLDDALARVLRSIDGRAAHARTEPVALWPEDAR